MRKKKVVNSFKLTVPALSRNESYCRSIAVAFAAQCDPTVEEIADIKTVISEAVTNCIVHAYKGFEDDRKKLIYISCDLFEDNTFRFIIKDKGCGIESLERAMEPLYTTDPENERSGMGLPIMKTFSDTFKLRSAVGKGTTVIFTKRVNSEND